MTYRVRSVLTAAALLLVSGLASSLLRAQATPPAPTPSTGFNLPRFGGQISYALTASQLITFGYAGRNANVYTTNLSGDAAYLSNSESHPFSMIYTGGVLASESTQIVPTTTYQNLSLSQVLRGKKDTFVVADTVSYLPSSPVAGLSGVPGVGDLGLSPVQIGGFNGPGILTNYATRLTNVVSASESHSITQKTSLQGTGSYAIQRFVGNIAPASTAYDNNGVTAAGGINHQFNARNSVGVNYTFSRFTYVSSPYTFNSSGVSVEYTHHFSPRLVFDGSVGPQWNTSTIYSATAVTVGAAATLTYNAERSSAGIAYTRGINNGSGVVQGAILDTVGMFGRRNFSRVLTGAVSASYSHASSLSTLLFPAFNVNSFVVSSQLSRSLGRSFSLYGSYTLLKQSSAGYLANTLAFDGLQQVVGFGITYSPRAHRIGR